MAGVAAGYDWFVLDVYILLEVANDRKRNEVEAEAEAEAEAKVEGKLELIKK